MKYHCKLILHFIKLVLIESLDFLVKLYIFLLFSHFSFGFDINSIYIISLRHIHLKLCLNNVSKWCVISKYVFYFQLAANATALVRLGVTVFACILLLRVTRRSLVLVSGAGTAICTLALAFLLIQGPGTGVAPPALILGYVAFNTLGFFLLPGLMIGELLPTKVRGLCGGYIFCLFNAVLFGFTKLYPIMKTSIGMAGVFGLFGASAALATIVLFLLYPETKGKSLIQIEQYYQKSNILWVTRKKMSDSQRV